MKLLHVSFLLLLSVLLVGAVVACGDDEEGNGTEPTATDEETAGPTDVGGEPSEEVTVEVADFSFDPDSFTVPAGTEVKVDVENVGNVAHTLTVYSDEEYTTAVEDADTGQLGSAADGEFFATFEAGDYYFRCENHPTQMEGELTAE